VFGAAGEGGQEEKKTSSSVRGGALHLLRIGPSTIFSFSGKELYEKLCVIHSTAKSGVTPQTYENILVLTVVHDIMTSRPKCDNFLVLVT
jgi:hypothetical protein